MASTFNIGRNGPLVDPALLLSDTGNALVPHTLTGGTKRALDLCIAGSVLLFTLPLLALLALAVWLSDGGSPFFAHRRRGLGGEHFMLLKFRTMRPNAEALLAELLASDPEAAREWDESHKLRHDPRITRLGRFLRKTSLDELPQLINVLRGDMSIVGPRPVLDEEHKKYYAAGRLYDQARPGITGLWQVAGRSNTTFAERVEMDVAYLSHWHIGRDVVLLIRTVPAVMSARGAR